MTHTHGLIEAKMYMKAKKEKQRKAMRWLGLEAFFCVSLSLLVQVMSHSTYNAMSVRSGAHN